MPYAFLPCTTGVTPKMSYHDDDRTISSPHCGGHSMPKIEVLEPEQISSPPCGGYSSSDITKYLSM